MTSKSYSASSILDYSMRLLSGLQTHANRGYVTITYTDVKILYYCSGPRAGVELTWLKRYYNYYTTATKHATCKLQQIFKYTPTTSLQPLCKTCTTIHKSSSSCCNFGSLIGVLANFNPQLASCMFYDSSMAVLIALLACVCNPVEKTH